MLYAEELKRFKSAFGKMVNDVDKIYLRELQANSHECAAACCRDRESPTEVLLQCVENCSEKLQATQRIVLEELDGLEDRFDRCISSCRSGDEDPNTFDACVRNCVDANVEAIPNLFKAINKALRLEKAISGD